MNPSFHMVVHLLQVLVYMSHKVLELEQVVQQDPNLTTAMPRHCRHGK